MDYVARAQALLKSQVKSAALVLIPLALAVGVAEASPILPVSAPTCDAPFGFVDGCSFTGSSVPGGGVSFTGASLISFQGMSGYLILSSGGGTKVKQSGAMNENYVGDIVANYSLHLDFFDYLNNDPISPQLLGITLGISQAGGNSYTMLISGTQTYSGSVTFHNVNLTAGLTTFTSFSLTAPSTTNVTLNFPSGGFVTFTPADSGPSVPEPASVVMVGLGLAMAWRRHRRRRT